MGSRAVLDHLEGSKISLPRRDSNHRLSDLQASHCTDFSFRKGVKSRRSKLVCGLCLCMNVCVCVCLCVCVFVRACTILIFEPTGRLIKRVMKFVLLDFPPKWYILISHNQQ